MSDSYFNILVLLTTANFPDIMLPSYSKNYWSCLFFIGFLIVGLYFLMSILLANVYMKFKQRIEKQCEDQLIKQQRLLEKYIDRFDKNDDDPLQQQTKKGYLLEKESVQFFNELLSYKIEDTR